MKMVKSLLLGSAAGLVAVTAGQAADLPVKAKPVEYVKVCSLYGAGFYYMPGTDMCIKIGGWVRAEAGWGYNGNLTWGPYSANANVRNTSNLTYRARGYITADAREQTAYGTARGYIAVGISTSDVGLNTPANQLSANRAFVQWAGITGGITQSFYDFYSIPAVSFNGIIPGSDTGDPGWTVFGYTMQLGNGLSATVAAEERRMTQIVDVNPTAATAPGGAAGLAGTAFTVGGNYFISNSAALATVGSIANGCYQNAALLPGSNSTSCGIFPSAGAYGGWQAPDIVANIRLDQAWGGAQLMGAAHELNANGYSVSVSPAAPGIVAATAASGHPSDTWGFALGAGLRLNFPMIAQGDYFQSQFNYTQGALRYVFFTPNTNWEYASGAQESYGVMSDAVFGSTGNSGITGNQLQLTTAWNINASYEHYWTPAFHESFYGTYASVSYNSIANNSLCALENGTGAAPSAAGATGAIAIAGCNNNWGVWAVGTRWQWDVTKTFYLGVDVMYEDQISATPNLTGVLVSSNNAAGGVASGAQGVSVLGSSVPAGGVIPNQVANESNWTARFRIHKDFLP
ncbi:MAG TPA: porin [Xanthobacteraceae bacterium]|nr:porin [Xanthobacteraceae bacterium]